MWFTIKSHGIDGLGAIVAKNCRQARHLGEAVVRQAPRLELLAPVSLNIVCFRYVPEGASKEAANALNKELVADLQEQGIAAPSTTTLGGLTAIRVCLVNHRTRTLDLDRLVEAVLRIGREREGSLAAE